MGVEPVAGAGGAEQDPNCPLEPPIQTAVPLATTSLTYFAGYDAELGQGTDRDDLEGLANLQFLARGCVTGEETNQAQFGSSGAQTVGGGTPTLGAIDDYPNGISITAVPPEMLKTFNLAAQQMHERSLSGYGYVEVSLGGYFFKTRQRSAVANCGDDFVSVAVPGRSLTVVFKITLPTAEERDSFKGCYLTGNYDPTLADDVGPAERYLVAHRAERSIAVLQSAGSAEDVQLLLNQTGCSAAHLSSCGLTLQRLQERLDAVTEALPDPSLKLHELKPSWGVSYLRANKYSVLF